MVESPCDGILGLNRMSKPIEMPSSFLAMMSESSASEASNTHTADASDQDKVGPIAKETNYIRAAYKQGAISKAMVSLLLGSEGRGAGGIAVIGGIDKRFADPSREMIWVPVLRGTRGMWAIKIHGLGVATKDKTNFCGERGCIGLIDSGTFGIIGSSEVISPILQAVGLTDGEKVDCFHKLPNLQFDFGTGGTPWELSLSRTYDVDDEAGYSSTCEPAMQSIDDSVWNDVKQKYPGMPIMVLGDPFLRTFYAALDNTDIHHPRVGLAYGKFTSLRQLDAQL
jgi:hypothetical protein